MHPDTNLREQLFLASKILYEGEPLREDVDRLAELVLALDEWIAKGGSLPKQWRKNDGKG
jgi:hypothetical protein